MITHRLVNTVIQNNYKKNVSVFWNDFNKKQKISFLTSLIDVMEYHEENKIKSEIHDRMSNLWSHLYARKAVGFFSPIISFSLHIIILLAFYFGNIALTDT